MFYPVSGGIFLNGLILDTSVILIFLIFLLAGFRSGVMKSFLSFAGAVFSVVFSVYLANILSCYVYVEFIKPPLLREIKKVISENSINSEQIFSKLPKFILNFLPSYGITPSSVNHIINSNSTVSAIPAQISELFSPVIVNVLKSAFTALLFIIFLILMRFFSKIILNMFKASLLKKSNTLLGGFFGLLKGYIAVMVCMCFIKVLLPMVQCVPDMLSPESVSSTYVFKKLYNNNPVYEFFKNI